MLKFADRTGRHHMLALDRYADHTTKDTWDYSAWIRVYSMYLDERLDVYRYQGIGWGVCVGGGDGVK